MALYGDEMTSAFELAVQRANVESRVIGRKAKTVRGIATTSQEGVTALSDACARRSVEGTVRPVGAKLGSAPEMMRRVA